MESAHTLDLKAKLTRLADRLDMGNGREREDKDESKLSVKQGKSCYCLKWGGLQQDPDYLGARVGSGCA